VSINQVFKSYTLRIGKTKGTFVTRVDFFVTISDSSIMAKCVLDDNTPIHRNGVNFKDIVQKAHHPAGMAIRFMHFIQSFHPKKNETQNL